VFLAFLVDVTGAAGKALTRNSGAVELTGQPVTVNSVELVLGSSAGADVEVRVGDTASFDDMSTAASASDVGGTVHLPLPTGGRSLRSDLVHAPAAEWQGEYQVSLSNASIDGHP
jgi:hypothetical protein